MGHTYRTAGIVLPLCLAAVPARADLPAGFTRIFDSKISVRIQAGLLHDRNSRLEPQARRILR